MRQYVPTLFCPDRGHVYSLDHSRPRRERTVKGAVLIMLVALIAALTVTYRGRAIAGAVQSEEARGR